jgi:hypothetical protein
MTVIGGSSNASQRVRLFTRCDRPESIHFVERHEDVGHR